MKVKITHELGEYDGCVGVYVEVDGANVGGGGFGGEPEDNCESRDYSWVRPLIEELAKALGAEVEHVEKAGEFAP